MSSQFATLCQETTLYNAWNIVKEKGAMGGIDGVTIQAFEKDKRREIPKLAEELANKKWKPYPYLEIEVAKDKSQNEKRKIGMTAIRDKIVQLAIKGIIEPRYDRLFVGNSYGYRPGKGATKTIRRVLQECKKVQICSTTRVHSEDWVNIYPLCTECYARITYIPDIKKKEPVKIAVI